MANAYQMDVEKIKEIMGDKEANSVKKDVCSRKALEFLVDNCKEV